MRVDKRLETLKEFYKMKKEKRSLNEIWEETKVIDGIKVTKVFRKVLCTNCNGEDNAVETYPKFECSYCEGKGFEIIEEIKND